MLLAALNTVLQNPCLYQLHPNLPRWLRQWGLQQQGPLLVLPTRRLRWLQGPLRRPSLHLLQQLARQLPPILHQQHWLVLDQCPSCQHLPLQVSSSEKTPHQTVNLAAVPHAH